MRMTVKVIDSQSHVARLANKAVDAKNILRSIGFNGYGYSIEVKRRKAMPCTRCWALDEPAVEQLFDRSLECSPCSRDGTS
jgi:hypothetical protein